MSTVSIQNRTRYTVTSRAAFVAVAKEMLPDWEISLAFVGPTTAKNLNQTLRKKSYTPNVLSYAAGKKNGEIIICPSVAKKEAPLYGLSEKNYILYLFIHGVLHIKGWAHGARMEKCEQTLLARYGTAHSDRHRYRHVPSKDGRGRRDHR